MVSEGGEYGPSTALVGGANFSGICKAEFILLELRGLGGIGEDFGRTSLCALWLFPDLRGGGRLGLGFSCSCSCSSGADTNDAAESLLSIDLVVDIRLRIAVRVTLTSSDWGRSCLVGF